MKTVVGRRRQVWVTPLPVLAEARDLIDCDRSLTSNCSNNWTPPHSLFPQSSCSFARRYGNNSGVLVDGTAQGWPPIIQASDLTHIYINVYSQCDLLKYSTKIFSSSFPCRYFYFHLFSFYSVHIYPSFLSVTFFLCGDGVPHSLCPGKAIQDSTKPITQPLSILQSLYIKIQHCHAAVSIGAVTWGRRLPGPLRGSNGGKQLYR